MTFVVTGGCIDVKDRTCIEQCPVDCIYEGARMLYIHPDECIDCGACEPTCPQEAIYHEASVPAGQGLFRAVADEFFAELGAAGGATDVDVTDRDHPVVAAMDRRAG